MRERGRPGRNEISLSELNPDGPFTISVGIFFLCAVGRYNGRKKDINDITFKNLNFFLRHVIKLKFKVSLSSLPAAITESRSHNAFAEQFLVLSLVSNLLLKFFKDFTIC